MNDTALIVLIVIIVAIAFLLYKVFKPYVMKHDTTILFTGTVGSGKTLNSVKQAIILYRKNLFLHYTMHNFWKVKVFNLFRKLANARKRHHNKRIRALIDKHPEKVNTYLKKLKNEKPLERKRHKPRLYTNIPVRYKEHFLSRQKKYSYAFTTEMFTCLQQMYEYSVVLIDEMPLLISQFDWNEELVIKNINEFITLFRHYVGGYLITNAQADSKIVKTVRDILCEEIYLRKFRTWFKLIYTVEAMDVILNENMEKQYTSAQVEEESKILWGLLPGKNTYASRCYKNRADNMLLDYDGNLKAAYPDQKQYTKDGRWITLYTNQIIRVKNYKSPCDDATTKEEKQEILAKIQKLKTVKEQKNEKTKTQPRND